MVGKAGPEELRSDKEDFDFVLLDLAIHWFSDVKVIFNKLGGKPDGFKKYCGIRRIFTKGLPNVNGGRKMYRENYSH